MKFINLFILTISFVYGLIPVHSQEMGNECVNPKNITIPLIVGFYDEIYYQVADKYTYWYKINVTTTCKLSYKLQAINSDDSYEMLIYNYRGTNFCNNIVQKKEKEITTKTQGTIAVKKGEIYYFNIIHLNGYGCGHTLFLDAANKSVTIKAVQNECVEDALETIIEHKEEQKVINQPQLIIPRKLSKQIKGTVVNGNTHKKIEAVVTILDSKGTPYQQINATADSGFVIANFDKDKIILSITKLGYESMLDTFLLTSDNLKIELRPIKIGSKLIMHKIYFYPNTYVLREESKKEIQKLTNFMLENSNYFFEIQGHTNGNRMIKKTKKYANLGKEWNFKGSAKTLSKLRAEKIKTYLVRQGIKENQLQTVGYGGDKMIIAKPKNMKQAMKNIRVEVIVIQ